jgi:hypothetical protein
MGCSWTTSSYAPKVYRPSTSGSLLFWVSSCGLVSEQRCCPGKATCSHGVVMELTHREIDQLYSDPSVSAYRAEAVLVALSDGSTVPALCFNLVEPPKPEERNAQYALKLREVGSRLGLPRAYTDKIE